MKAVVLVAALLCACGAPMDEGDGGVDGGRDAGIDAGVRDAGVFVDAGVTVVDAGPPPPPTASGSITVNGANLMVMDGFGSRLGNSLQLHLNTRGDPLVQLTIVVPASASVGVPLLCGGPETVLFSGRWSVGGQIAFFTLDQICEVRLTQLAADAGDDYSGTFTGTATYEPRSALDAGFQTLTITNGSFTVRRF